MIPTSWNMPVSIHSPTTIDLSAHIQTVVSAAILLEISLPGKQLSESVSRLGSPGPAALLATRTRAALTSAESQGPAQARACFMLANRH